MKKTAPQPPQAPHPLLAAREPDTGSIRIAFLCAIAAHLAILMAPWEKEPVHISVQPVPEPIQQVKWEPKLPENKPPAPVQPETRIRRIPLPMDAIEVESLDPVRKATPVEADMEGDFEVEPILGDPSMPPEPAVIEQGVEGLELPVRMAGMADPEYPQLAVEARITGTVVLRAVIDRNGHVIDIEVLRAPSPEVGLTQAAVDAVSSWRYRPGKLHGRAVAVRMTVVVTFHLQ